MSWKHVFAARIPYFSYLHTAAAYAFKGGYKFLQWNEDVFFILDAEGKVAETGIKTEELIA